MLKRQRREAPAHIRMAEDKALEDIEKRIEERKIVDTKLKDYDKVIEEHNKDIYPNVGKWKQINDMSTKQKMERDSNLESIRSKIDEVQAIMIAKEEFKNSRFSGSVSNPVFTLDEARKLAKKREIFKPLFDKLNMIPTEDNIKRLLLNVNIDALDNGSIDDAISRFLTEQTEQPIELPTELLLPTDQEQQEQQLNDILERIYTIKDRLTSNNDYLDGLKTFIYEITEGKTVVENIEEANKYLNELIQKYSRNLTGLEDLLEDLRLIKKMNWQNNRQNRMNHKI